MPLQPIFRPEDFPNQLGLLPLTSTDVKRQISSYKLTFLEDNNEDIEYNIGFPQFAKSFYNYVYKYRTVPDQPAFFNFYLLTNKDFFNENVYTSEQMTALKARVYRMYPSFVRELHFNKLLMEQVPALDIIYNSLLDIQYDADTMLVKGGKYWAACQYTPTDRAESARTLKENRHIRFSNVTYIEFPVKFDKAHKFYDFYLYGMDDIVVLLNNILS